MGRLTDTMIICGKDCDDCRYSTFNEENKAKIMIYCSMKDKWYIYGQCVPCEFKEKVTDDET